MSVSLCPLPWMSQAIRNNGDLRVCCQANVSEGQGVLRDNNGQLLNAAKANLSETRNSQLMNDVRLTMLNGRWPKSCQRCFAEEASGVRSRRIYETELRKDWWNIERAKKVTDSDGKIQLQLSPVEAIDIRFGNHCNLRCRMCGPTDSDAWYEDYVSFSGSEFLDSAGDRVGLAQSEAGIWKASTDKFLWYESESFWEQLQSSIPNLKYVHIVGGEPLLIRRHFDFLQSIIDMGRAEHVTLEYNTNLTVLPDSALDLWRHFKKVRIGVSVDGVGPLNDYIRYPCRWPTIERNLQKLNDAPGSFDLWIATTVQNLNIFHIPKLIEWNWTSPLHRLKMSKASPFLTSHILHQPERMNIRALPQELKQQVRVLYADFLERFPSNLSLKQRNAGVLMSKLEKLVSGYLRYMDSEDWSRHFPEFVRHTKHFDLRRQQRVQQLNPQFAPWFEQAQQRELT